MSSEHLGEYFTETADDPAYVVQPDEMRAYKEIRLAIDDQFLNTKPFWSSHSRYVDIIPTHNGIDLHIRSRLFGTTSEKRSELSNYSETTRRESTSTVRHRDSSEDIRDPKVSTVKLSQRESKQKDRFESRLLSLLFAAVHDTNTKKGFLLQGIPSLRVFRHDKNGKRRRVSNFEDVRQFLRHKMILCISLHTKAMRTLTDLAPEHVLLFPVITVTVARIFLPIFYYRKAEFDDINTENPHIARQALRSSIHVISKFIQDWERRNYSSDTELKGALKAGKDHELYRKSERLILAMINVIPPSKPTLDKFKKSIVYPHGIVGRNECRRGKHKSCAVCDLSTQDEKIDTWDDNTPTVCREYVEAVCKCISLDPPALRTLNKTVSINQNHPAVRKRILSTVAVHRLQSLSRAVLNNKNAQDQKFRILEFVDAVRWDVARMWIALDTSNKEIMSYIAEMKFGRIEEKIQAVTELILGATVSTRVLLEDRDKLRRVLDSLRNRGCKRGISMIEGDASKVLSSEGRQVTNSSEDKDDSTAHEKVASLSLETMFYQTQMKPEGLDTTKKR